MEQMAKYPFFIGDFDEANSPVLRLRGTDMLVVCNPASDDAIYSYKRCRGGRSRHAAEDGISSFAKMSFKAHLDGRASDGAASNQKACAGRDRFARHRYLQVS